MPVSCCNSYDLFQLEPESQLNFDILKKVGSGFAALIFAHAADFGQNQIFHWLILFMIAEKLQLRPI